MARYSYNDILGFKAGERYCESCQYGNMWFTVKTDAVEAVNGEYKQVQFVGVADDGKEIKYSISKGFEHYGPQIYDEPAYLSLADIQKILNDKEQHQMTTETVDIIIPSNPADRKALFDGIKEISNSMTRVEGERDYQKEAVEALAEKHDIDKKYIRRMAVDFHKDTFDKKASEQEQYQDLYEAIINGVVNGDDEEDDDEE